LNLNNLDFKSSQLQESILRTTPAINIRQHKQLRWFDFSDDTIQGLMDITQPEHVLSPVHQSMLLFLLWKKQPLSLLNLGMGCGIFERYLTKNKNIKVTSVEQNIEVIHMAIKHFSLPENSQITQQCAYEYLQENNIQTIEQEKIFDVVLCDLFIDKKSPSFMYHPMFYQNLRNSMNQSSVAFINLSPDDNDELLSQLFIIRKYFLYIALVSFDGYQNIIVMLSNSAFPSTTQLKR
jgi:spermidine synthase